jgi:ABC transporter DrrB family efflux protein
VPSRRQSPLLQITLSRVREFYREPAAIFWVYGFPLLMALALGIAFRQRPVEQPIAVDLVGSGAQALQKRLGEDKRFKINLAPAEDWKKRLRAGKTDLVIEVSSPDGTNVTLWDEPHRTESVLARYAAELALRNESQGTAPASSSQVAQRHLEEKGIRYIDYLMPGMLGMNLMGGGLWGVGFVMVDMRVRKLLKRFLATPMRRSDFLLGVMLSRLLFTFPEVLILLGFGYLAFGVGCEGNLLLLIGVILLGGCSFAGIGLLVASRAKTVETVSGLMNLVMLPMWILSGVFFSYERFPEAAHPVIRLLPLTALNDALRGVMLDGQSAAELWPQLTTLAVWGGVSFVIALRIFRWR